MNKVLAACTIAAGASLSVVYLLSTALFLQHLDASNVDTIESVIVATQVLRLAGIIAYFGSKPARIEVMLVLFSLETFIVMGLIVTYLLSPAAFLSQLAHEIFSTWMSSLFTILPPYLIFTGVGEMARNKGLVQVVLPISLEFGFLTFSASTLLGFPGTFTLGDFFDFLTSIAKSDLAGAVIPQLSTIFLLVPSVTIYCALLVYAAIPGGTNVVSPKPTFVLPLLGSLLSLAWVFGSLYLSPNTLLSFTAPGIIIAGFLWAYMRR